MTRDAIRTARDLGARAAERGAPLAPDVDPAMRPLIRVHGARSAWRRGYVIARLAPERDAA